MTTPLTTTPACSVTTPSACQLSIDKNGSIQYIGAEELKPLLDANPALPLLDVRTPAEFRQVHVKGATLIPLDQLNAHRVDEAFAESEAPLYILCKGGGRANKAAQLLSALGKTCVVITGGTDACLQHEIVTAQDSSCRIISLERQVRIAAGSLVLLGVGLTLTIHVGFIGLAAFVGAGLIFAGITDFCGMGLLLAKLPWNR